MSTSRFEIGVRSPFRLDLTTWALRRRAHNAVDRFDSATYRRTLLVDGRAMETAVREPDTPGDPSRPVLVVEVSAHGVPSGDDRTALTGQLVRVLGLHSDIRGFYDLAARDERLTALAARFIGMRPPRFPTVFESLVNAITCQQLSLTVGIHLLNRLAHRYGARVPGVPDAVAFPRPEQLCDADIEELRALGFSRSKANAVRSLSRRVAPGGLDLEALVHADDEAARSVLMGLHGIGRWSTEYTLLRGLGRLEVLPGDDVGARNNLRRRFGLAGSAGYGEMASLARAWWPYGGLVYLHLLLDALAEEGHLQPSS